MKYSMIVMCYDESPDSVDSLLTFAHTSTDIEIIFCYQGNNWISFKDNLNKKMSTIPVKWSFVGFSSRNGIIKKCIEHANNPYILFVRNHDWIKYYNLIFNICECDYDVNDDMLIIKGETNLSAPIRRDCTSEDIIEYICYESPYQFSFFGVIFKKSLFQKIPSSMLNSKWLYWVAIMQSNRFACYGNIGNKIERQISMKELEFLSEIRTKMMKHMVILPKIYVNLKYQIIELCHIIDNVIYQLYFLYSKVSTKKCVLIFSNDSSADKFGIGTYVKALSACFNPTEWDICIVKLYSSNTTDSILIDDEIAHISFNGPQTHEDEWSAELEKKYNVSVFHRLACFFNGRSHIYCHFNIFGDAHLANLLRSRIRARIIFTIHYMNWRFELLDDIDRMKRIINKQNDMFERTIYNRFLFEQNFLKSYCDHVITIAKHSYEILLNMYEIKQQSISIIPNGVAQLSNPRILNQRIELRQRMNIAYDDKILLYVGRLEKSKGIFSLIDAFGVLLKTHPKLHLLIAGNGNFGEMLSYSSSNWKHIHYVGFVNHTKLKEYYTIADIGIVPSFHEELGYVALEMLQFNIPLIVAARGGLEEIVNKTGKGILFHYSRDFKRNDMVNKIEKLLSTNDIEKNHARRKNLGSSYDYSLKKFREEIVKLYNSLK